MHLRKLRIRTAPEQLVEPGSALSASSADGSDGFCDYMSSSAFSTLKTQPAMTVLGIGVAITAYFMIRDPNTRSLVRAQTSDVSRLVRKVSENATVQAVAEPFGQNETAKQLKREAP